ncbi:uncharacterized protein A4U43_C10F14140 [Asparagus officinalis]|uniref:TIR domain-containing protein n=1 Tax=Asparagus officinalis TaxID=4686 RepID=A0A5P1E4H7_ASPOF|nr:uncharacterized protein LOC109825009 [Asparagus officinalis]XP_020247254.1 uncharacterized protein LOC109825009 [Asparagus officinalis]XP_020247255.1 uncharacterized protein LOC109825009 [Asparagus officinalis]XP_020247257.1 uncharacterized protein LOC109825009 [Asparagus officinalis]XP_020247258.1 uncharacterized protein LOC109825009 [Asparagus officinalis]XP_020247259.1 uncharacterized protein LOC109825009 [Asparagus officinalis]XP_020247260.1 uncharacterized protein LOC109825009 [Aspara
MEFQQESSNLGVLSTTTSRHFSSSSSAFVSASQSPFFSPRSPQAQEPEPILRNSCSGLIINGDLSTSTIVVKQPKCISNLNFVLSDVSPAPSFCPSSNFETPVTVFRENGICSSSNYSQGRRGKLKRTGRCKLSFVRPSPSVSSSSRLRSCDVYIGFHGRKPSLLRFANWLRAELELQGISCFASDRARCRNSRSHETVQKAMNASSFGVVILTRKSFGNAYTIEELRHFLGKKNLCPIFFDLGVGDCLARDIIEKRGELWEKHGGELWVHYDGLEKEWRAAVDGLSRLLDWQLEAYDGNWRDCISNAVVLLATRLGRRSAVERVNRWRERVEKEEFPFPRNEDFVGRKKEISELELILFGDVSRDCESEYFEIKTRHKRKNLMIERSKNYRGDENATAEQSESKSEKEIEMLRVGSPQRQLRPLRTKNCANYGRRKRSTKILYGKGVACVSGDSGIGKTELILEYAYRFSQRYKMVLWVGGENRYIRQNYLNLRNFLEIDLSIEHHSLEKGKVKCFEEQEEDAIAKVRKEFMRDIPFLVVIDNLESEKDWWDRKSIMDLLPRFGGETHFIITTRLPRVMNLEPMKLSYLSGIEALSLMKGGVRDYPIAEIDALREIEEKLGRLTLGLGIIGAILSELPITPSRLLDTINRMPLRGPTWNDKEVITLKRNPFLVQLLDVCLSIFDHADGPRSLATRMVQVSGWFAPSPIPIPLLALTAHKIPRKHRRSRVWRKCVDAITCSFSASYMKRSEAEAASMLTRFGIARNSTKPDCIHFHEIIKLYARKRGSSRIAQAMIQSVYLRGSIPQYPEHLWAACFLLFGFGNDPVVIEPSPSELLLFVKRVVLPLAVHTFITFSRCDAALELLRLCTDTLELTAESMVSRAEKWLDRSFCCLKPAHSDAQYTYLWQELALMRATVLETRVKLMLKGGQFDIGDDLIRKAIFIRTSICGEHHPDTVSARNTLGKLTRLLTNIQS